LGGDFFRLLDNENFEIELATFEPDGSADAAFAIGSFGGVTIFGGFGVTGVVFIIGCFGGVDNFEGGGEGENSHFFIFDRGGGVFFTSFEGNRLIGERFTANGDMERLTLELLDLDTGGDGLFDLTGAI